MGRVSPESVWPFLDQVKEGSGFPVAVQVREMLEPSNVLVAWGGTVMSGGVSREGARKRMEEQERKEAKGRREGDWRRKERRKRRPLILLMAVSI